MARLSWTLQALEDLEAIVRFIQRSSPRFAEAFAERVFDAADRLGTYPLSGRMVPDWQREDLREVLVGGYRLIYRLVEDEVEILTLHHMSRPLQGLVHPP